MAFLIRWLERWQEMGWRRRRVTCSEGPQVGLEPSAAAATTKPRCMGCELYWTNAVPGRSRLQTSDYASSPHLEQNLYCPHRGIASPPLAKLNSHCGNRCCLQAQCNPCTSQYDQIISLWEADDTEIDSSHNKTRFQWASIISEPVRNDLNMRGILLPTEKKKKKSSRALSVTKAVGTVWCMCPGRLWDSSLCCFMPFVMKGPPSRAHTVKTPC